MPERLQALHEFDRGLFDVHDRTLGDFQFQITRRNAGLFQYAGNVFDQIIAPKLHGGKIHGDAGQFDPGFAPLTKLQAGLLDHDAAQIHDHAGLFGEGDELAWIHQAALRMLPTAPVP